MTLECTRTDLGFVVRDVDGDFQTPPYDSEYEAWMRAAILFGNRLSGLIREVTDALEGVDK